MPDRAAFFGPFPSYSFRFISNLLRNGEQIEAMTQEAREVAKRLDAIVRNALSGDGATFAVWEKACHRWGPTIEGQELTANKSGDSATCGGIEVSNSAGH